MTNEVKKIKCPNCKNHLYIYKLRERYTCLFCEHNFEMSNNIVEFDDKEMEEIKKQLMKKLKQDGFLK